MRGQVTRSPQVITYRVRMRAARACPVTCGDLGLLPASPSGLEEPS
jgi:hypothetical protein